jgi:hypothetical protein
MRGGGRFGGTGREGFSHHHLLTSRRCLCILSRYPILDVHAAVLAACIRDRSQMVARRMSDILACDSDGNSPAPGAKWHPRSNSFGVQDWWGLGNSPSSFAQALLRNFRKMPVPAPDEPFPSALWVEGTEIALPARRWCGGRGGARVEEGVYCEAESWCKDLPQDSFGVDVLLGYLSLESIMSLVSALLLERRVVVQCSDPFILSAVAMALPQMIRPYQWQTHFIPFLPPSIEDFLLAPVPFIAGVLQAPQGGYEPDHIVLVVERDTVLGAESIPKHPALTAVMGKLRPLHDNISTATCCMRWPRRLSTEKRDVSAAETIKEIVRLLSTSISSIISLFEIRGHCIAGRDLVSGEVLTKETKLSYLRTVPEREVEFMGQLLDTQLFSSHLLGLVSLWLSQVMCLHRSSRFLRCGG